MALIPEPAAPVAGPALHRGLRWLEGRPVLPGGCWAAGPHRLYRVGRELQPVEVGWRWFVCAGSTPVGLVDVRGEGRAVQPVGAIGAGPAVALARAISLVEALPVAAEDVFLRVIRLPTWSGDLLWLHHPSGGRDWLVLTRARANYRAWTPYPFEHLPQLARLAVRHRT